MLGIEKKKMHICIEWIFAAKKLTVVEFDGSLAELTIELNNGKFLRCEDPFNAYVHFFFLYSEHSFS